MIPQTEPSSTSNFTSQQQQPYSQTENNILFQKTRPSSSITHSSPNSRRPSSSSTRGSARKYVLNKSISCKNVPLTNNKVYIPPIELPIQQGQQHAEPMNSGMPSSTTITTANHRDESVGIYVDDSSSIYSLSVPSANNKGNTAVQQQAQVPLTTTTASNVALRPAVTAASTSRFSSNSSTPMMPLDDGQAKRTIVRNVRTGGFGTNSRPQSSSSATTVH